LFLQQVVSLMKDVEKILADDVGESLWKRVLKLEAENSRLTATAVESSETITKMQRSLDNGVEDYNLLMAGNESMLAEHNDLCHHTEDLESELANIRDAIAEDVTALETKIEFAEAHIVDVAAAGEKCLKDFEDELVEDLAGLRALYICNINHIRGLCSPMPESEPSPWIIFASCPRRLLASRKCLLASKAACGTALVARGCGQVTLCSGLGVVLGKGSGGARGGHGGGLTCA
jgi:hypothetical protein